MHIKHRNWHVINIQKLAEVSSPASSAWLQLLYGIIQWNVSTLCSPHNSKLVFKLPADISPGPSKWACLKWNSSTPFHPLCPICQPTSSISQLWVPNGSKCCDNPRHLGQLGAFARSHCTGISHLSQPSNLDFSPIYCILLRVSAVSIVQTAAGASLREVSPVQLVFYSSTSILPCL